MAAARLVDEGYDVIGITLRLWDGVMPGADGACDSSVVDDARRAADHLGIEHRVVDWRDRFEREVVAPFVDSYLSGWTPSPCARCNQVVKLPALLHSADEAGAAVVATGHYARVVRHRSGVRVARGADPRKDQSYFLCMVPTSALERLRLPLGDDDKEGVRREARRRGLPAAHKRESQDLCFVPDGDYVALVERQARDRIRPGWVVDASGRRLERHAGVHRFTRGQRKGLGVNLGRRVYVSSMDAATGDVVVDDEGSVLAVSVEVADPVLGTGLVLPARARVQVRYRDGGIEASLEAGDSGVLQVRFDRPVRAASPGQYAVAYDGDEVVAGGVITWVCSGPAVRSR